MKAQNRQRLIGMNVRPELMPHYRVGGAIFSTRKWLFNRAIYRVHWFRHVGGESKFHWLYRWSLL